MTQRWNPKCYATSARFVAELGEPLVGLLAPKAGERILDLGCGDGALTEKLAATGATVVGVDASPEMVAAARARGLDARVMDGQSLDFDREFDAVLSNAALHWMRQSDAVLKGVRRALKPGGRLVAEFGGAGNVASVAEALIETLSRRDIDGRALVPWYYPTPEQYRRLLEANGFAVDSIELIPRPTPIPGELADWLDTFAGSFLSAVPMSERDAVKREVAERLAPKLRDRSGKWILDYVRLRVVAHI
jgi:trans-aconitate methyltransferase